MVIQESSSSEPVTDNNIPKTQEVTPEKVIKICSPEYVVYTDAELEHVRKYYFELHRNGQAHECVMSKELRCRLVRNTITSMISIVRGYDMKERRDWGEYPSREELTAMAMRVIQYYPMLQDANGTKPWVSFIPSISKVVMS